jgi:hypothetical protein
MHIGPVVVSGPVEVLVSVLVVLVEVVVSGPVVEVVVSGSVVLVVVVPVVVVVVDVGSSVGSTGWVVLMVAPSLSLPSGSTVVGATVVPGPVEVVESPVVLLFELGGPALTRPLPSKLQAKSRVNAVQRARTG